MTSETPRRLDVQLTPNDLLGPTVAVPLELLERAARLIQCDEHGNWCGEHEAQSWPCPLEQLKRLWRAVDAGRLACIPTVGFHGPVCDCALASDRAATSKASTSAVNGGSGTESDSAPTDNAPERTV